MVRSTQQPDPLKTPNGGADDSLFSPGFKSVVAMAGWDEEAILIASLVVDDTPERELKQKKRHPDLQPKTPPTNSRRKRRVPRRSPIPATVLNLDDLDSVPDKPRSVKTKIESKTGKNDDKKRLEIEDFSVTKCEASSSSGAVIPCMDKLREELSCAICLEICYEPSTTACGHSFCKKCLRSSADKCGKKCPKCRQLIGNGRSCTVNTVLWNTIQLLFPKEIESRKKAAEGSQKSPDSSKRRTAVRVGEQHIQSPTFRAMRVSSSSSRSPTFHPIRVSSRNREGTRLDEAPRGLEGFQHVRNNRDDGARRRREALVENPRRRREVLVEGARRRREVPVPSQAEDAALALRLQREEFMEAFRGGDNESSSVAAARANLRAMASRAMSLRVSRGGRP